MVSGELTDNPQAQTEGSASCPTGTRLVGGGAVIASSSLSENLNLSAPDGQSWIAYIDNASTTAGTFYVYADCVKKVSKYTVVESTAVDNPAGVQSTATATCPSKTVVLGGGGSNGSTSTAVIMNSSLPSGTTGWRVDVNNNGGDGDTMFAWAICGKKPSGYTVVSGSATALGASAQGSSDATCPSGTVVLSGGGFSSSSSTTVDLNSTYPLSSTVWRAYEDDTATITSSITALAVCAKA